MSDHKGRAVIAGASGFVGQYLQDAFRDEGYEVVTIGRTGDAVWGNTMRIRELVDGAALVVNMAGKSVNCRYGRRNRAEIIRSRVDTTLELAEAIRTSEHPPPLWVNASTATIYRHADDRPQDEATGELGEGFSVSVATAWEDALSAIDLPGTRRVALRMAIVFGDGSALVPLLRLAQAGLGGPQYDGPWFPTRSRLRAGTYHVNRHTRGRQRFSWVHIADVLGAIRFVRDHEDIDGAVNVSSPNPSDNRTVMATIRDAVGRRFGIPTWRWMLELGSFAIRTETELVLKSRWVVPTRLVEAGYEFRYPHLRGALAGIIAERRQHRG
ncbi:MULTISPECIES: epimerase [unclassified Curtobacterium]|uniref:epimerase n=1 Tax=unclassified Curtobacterium TaxID=257496 RepID=UPI0039AF5214